MFGKVKFYDDRKGFGFITRDDGQGDIFLGERTLTFAGLSAIDEGDAVEFETETDSRGRTRAINLRMVRPAAREPVRP